jgi:hypothetical protein
MRQRNGHDDRSPEQGKNLTRAIGIESADNCGNPQDGNRSKPPCPRPIRTKR